MSDVREALTSVEDAERAGLDRAIREVFATASGKRFMFWLLSTGSPYADAFTGDDAATNYTLGKKAGALALIAKLDELDARYYPQLLLAVADMREADRSVARAAAANMKDDDNESAP